MQHIIVPTSTRTPSETRAERRRREEEEERRRQFTPASPRAAHQLTSPPPTLPTRQDSRNISTWEETLGSGLLRQEQPDAELLGWGEIGRPLEEAYKHTVLRAAPLGYTVSPWLDYDRPDMFREGWTKPRVPTRMTGNPMMDLLGTFKPTTDPVGETAKKSWEHFKRTGRYGGLTEEQYAAMPLS